MKTLVWVEHDNASLADATLAAVTAAGKLGEVHLLVAGSGCRAVADQAAKIAGVGKVHIADDEAYANALAENVAPLVAELMEHHDAFVAPATTTGKNIAPRVAASFSAVFWSASRGHLTDHLSQDESGAWVEDTSLRPNMMIACALAHSPVKPEHAAASIAAVKAKLLTPVGLRTLPRDDASYHTTYAGPAFERDGAYHRGIVWPWLIGPYAEAVLRAGGFSPAAKREAEQALAPLIERLTTTHHPGALGQLHEIHEPEPPFAPRGCPAQAWSVAEVLRLWMLLQA